MKNLVYKLIKEKIIMSKKITNNFKRFKEKLKENEKKSQSFREELKSLKIEDIKAPGITFAEDVDIKPCMGEPDYFVTNCGQLFHRCKNGAIKHCKITYIQPSRKIDKKYGQVHINGRADYIHRVVAEVWCDGFDPVSRNEVHHKDHDTTNNHFKNLKWVSKEEHYWLDRNVESVKKMMLISIIKKLEKRNKLIEKYAKAIYNDMV